jgi:hypothetical protein
MRSRGAELEGASDFQVEASLGNLAAYHDLMVEHVDPARRLISHYESSFVSRRYLIEDCNGFALWTSDRNGSRRLDLERAICVTAEGDYVRLHFNGHSELIHATLQSIVDRLPDHRFLSIHRSTTVRLDALIAVEKDGRRHLAQLCDGSRHLIAKSRVASVLRAHDPSSAGSCSSSTNGFDRTVRPNERIADAPARLC